eukprot:6178681-Pleurochrysis_carterae.AAC.1
MSSLLARGALKMCAFLCCVHAVRSARSLQLVGHERGVLLDAGVGGPQLALFFSRSELDVRTRLCPRRRRDAGVRVRGVRMRA